MIKRIGNILVCFTILSVFSLVVDCGCEYAHAAVQAPTQAETHHMAHCDTANEDPQECCTSCVLEDGAPHSEILSFLSKNSSNSVRKVLSSHDSFSIVVSDYFLPPESGFRDRLIGFSPHHITNPLFISFKSLLI